MMIDQREWNSTVALDSLDIERRTVLPDISIIIPTLGRPILEECLLRVLMGSAWPACLIVVEQGSNPRVARWLGRVEQIGVQVDHVVSTQRGRSAGINRGLQQANTRFVAITDDDCFVAETWLSSLAAGLRQHPGAVSTGRVEAGGQGMLMVVTSHTPSIQLRPRLKFDSLSGGNMGASLDILRKVGPFNEDPVMATAEDAEWAYRALRLGVPLAYEPEACVQHFGWRAASERTEQYRRYALSHGGFYGKYLRKGDLFIFLRAMLHFGRALQRWLRGKMAGNAELAIVGKAYSLYLLPGIQAGFRSIEQPGRLQDRPGR